MSLTDAAARKFAALLRRVRAAPRSEEPAPPSEHPQPLGTGCIFVGELVYSTLLYDADKAQARQALRRVREAFVDDNELRVSSPRETAEILGEKYPHAHERALRLRSMLDDVYQRQHVVSLAHLRDAPKREARAYLESLAGCAGFAAARVMLLHLDGHAFPVDRHLRDRLALEGVAEPDIDPDILAGRLERHIRSEETLETYTLLAAWAGEEPPPAPRPESKPSESKPAVRAAKSSGRRKSQGKGSA